MNNPVAPAQRPTRWPLLMPALVVAIILTAGVAAGEALGWRFLVSPMQSWLSKLLDRRVDFGPGADGAAGKTRIKLLGHIQVQAPRIEIAAPAWSQAPHTLLAHDASLTLGYADLWRVWRGQTLHIRSLEASDLDLQLERQANGQATWQFGEVVPSESPDIAMPLPSFGTLRVNSGHLNLSDKVVPADIQASFALREGQDSGLTLKASGSYLRLPLRIDLSTAGVIDVLVEGNRTVAHPLLLKGTIGRAELNFKGTITDPLHFTGLGGHFSLAGPSLAVVGDPLGITLPATPAFRTQGTLVKDHGLWKAVVEDARIGASRLSGAFTYDSLREVPLLAGRLVGSKLLLSDLGPALGAPPAGDGVAKEIKAPGRVLPDRKFDLPSLRKMDANVLIDIAELNTGTELLAALRPLRTHLQLTHGVLSLSDIEAQTASGRLLGYLQLDGRDKEAKWTADLRLLSLDLAQWLKLRRGDNKPPYIAGKLDAQIKVAGTGRSTAEILASLNGDLRMHMRQAAISHLVVEAAGIDVAQGLGMVFKGDDALPILCNVADFSVSNGIVRPKVFVINTRDSTIWLDGSASLRNESLDVRAVVSPKDFSPLTLRTPVHVRGTFNHPAVSLETGALAGKVGAAGLLALLNPLAAIIPFIDPGADKEAQAASAECAKLVPTRSRIAKAVLRPGPPAASASSPSR